MPFNPKFTITPKINKALVEIERVCGFLDAVKLKDDWLADMQKEALRLESHIQHIISCGTFVDWFNRVKGLSPVLTAGIAQLCNQTDKTKIRYTTQKNTIVVQSG